MATKQPNILIFSIDQALEKARERQRALATPPSEPEAESIAAEQPAAH